MKQPKALDVTRSNYSVRLSPDEDAVLKLRMRNLGYRKAAPFLKDAALGHLGRDAADGLAGWRHDVLERLNDILAQADERKVRQGLMDVARRIERSVRDTGDADVD